MILSIFGVKCVTTVKEERRREKVYSFILRLAAHGRKAAREEGKDRSGKQRQYTNRTTGRKQKNKQRKSVHESRN